MREKDNLLTQKDSLLVEKDTQLARQQEVINKPGITLLLCVLLLQTFQADLTGKDDIIARKNRELGDKDKLLSQQANQLTQNEATIADKEATIVAERERALAEREALIQVARPAVTLCPTLVHLLCWLRCSLTCTGTQGTDWVQRC